MNINNQEESKQLAARMLYDLFVMHDEEGVWEHGIKILIDRIVDAAATEVANRLLNARK